MYLSDYDARIAQERYNDAVNHARLLRLIRAAQAAQQPATPPKRSGSGSLLDRVLAAIFARRMARA